MHLKIIRRNKKKTKLIMEIHIWNINKKTVINPYNNKQEVKILNACAEIPLELEEVDFVFVKKNGVYEGTDSCKYPFKVIHYELGIPCRFHDFRDTHATKLIETGADIKAVSKRLGYRSIVLHTIYMLE